MAVHVEDERRAAAEDRSLGELFGELSGELSTLMRQELDLAKAEMREEAKKAGKAGALLGGATLTAYFCLLLLSFAAAWGLAAVMPTGAAFLIVAMVHGVVAAALFSIGRSQLREVHPAPTETVGTLKEDVQWAKAQLK